jgi:uncharacterized protein YceK
MRRMRVITAAITAAAVLSGCSSTTVIRSTRPTTKIYIDGEFAGTGTATHTDQKPVGARTHVRLHEPGCKEQRHTIIRNEEFEVGACIGGVFLVIPFLWVMGYKPERTYEYECLSENEAASSSGAPYSL